MKIILQIGIIFLICLVGEGIASILPFSFPSSVISMLLLFLLLLLRILRPEHIRQKTDFLLKNMAFFFIPAGVGILEQFTYIWDSMLPILLICVVSTVLTFAATAYTVKAVCALQERLRKRGKRL